MEYSLSARIILNVLCCVTFVGCVTVEYDILVLVPLTGEREGQGKAQLVGVRSALNAEGYNLTSGHTLVSSTSFHGNLDISHMHIFYQDTQCNREKEDANILKHLSLTPSRRLIVIGGFCQTSSPQHVTTIQDSYTIRQSVPQILLDEAPLQRQDVPSTLISLRPSITHAYPHLVAWLQTNDFWQVAVAVVRTSLYTEDVRPTLADYLLSNNINISINVNLGQIHFPVLLEESKSRIVVVESGTATDIDVLCQLLYKTSDLPGRYIWIVMVTDAMTTLQGRSRVCQFLEEEPAIYFFNVETTLPSAKRYNDDLIHSLKSVGLEVTPDSYDDAAFAYDATVLALRTVKTFRQVASTVSSSQFTDRFIYQLTRGTYTYATGDIIFDEGGTRLVPIDILSFKGTFIVPINMTGLQFGNSTVEVKTTVDGIPTALFIIMAALSFLGIVYTTAIFTFNVLKRNDRMIKMTSPNINLIILLGAAMGYISMVTLGLDSSRVSLGTMSKLIQTSIFLLAIGYSLIFGSLFAKAWRVFFIFKNLNANGKNTRDEHLLLGIILLVVADIVVLIPWAVVDPVKCSRMYVSTNYQDSPPTDVIHEQDVCTSDLLVMWILVIFALKSAVLIAGFYFTYQARHVTLPTLRDAKQIYVIIYTVVVLGVISLPLLLTPRLSAHVKYSVGALVIFSAITAVLTLAFVPKMYYLWMRAEKNSQESVRFLFSESLRRTQKQLASCSLCFCFGSGGEEDKYAQQVLGSEIATLKRTIKEKDATIRELTDRLYFGTEKKLHEYISSPRHRPLYRPEPVRPISQQPNSSTGLEHSIDQNQADSDPATFGAAHPDSVGPNLDVSDSGDSSHGSSDSMYRSFSQKTPRENRQSQQGSMHPPMLRTKSVPLMSLSVRGLKENNSKIESQIANNLDTPIKERYHPHREHMEPVYQQDLLDTPGCNSTNNGTMLTDITLTPHYNSSSPNHDSAIDNNSPSSINSDQQSLTQELSLHPEDPAAISAIWNHRGKLDLEAIEREAMRLDSSHGSRSFHSESPQVHNQGFLQTETPYITRSEHPYSVRKVHRNSFYNSSHHQNSACSPRHEHYGHNLDYENACNHDRALYENYPIPSDHNYHSHHAQMGEGHTYIEDGVNVSQI